MASDVNATEGDITFINSGGANQTARVIPYENVTEQTYLEEFKSLLSHMDRSDIYTVTYCWQTIVVPPEYPGTWELQDVHVTKCWS